MKKVSVIIVGFLISFNSFAVEANWETLKTLGIDTKTKKAIITSELQKVLNNEVTIKGFMMPLDYEAREVVEFLFMPYVPACMHVPPPPANQLILVKMKKGNKIKPSFYPIELTGKLFVDANVELESSYKMEGLKIKELKDAAPMQPPGATP